MTNLNSATNTWKGQVYVAPLGKYRRMPYNVDPMRNVEEYRIALENFNKNVAVTRELGCCSLYPDPIVEEYFHAVALTGVTSFKWKLIRGPFIWKLEKVLDDVVEIEDELRPQVFIEKRMSEDEMADLKHFIITKAHNFTYAPFTIQRLCELLALPTYHYQVAEKFYRAIEKNINIVMEVEDEEEEKEEQVANKPKFLPSIFMQYLGWDEPCSSDGSSAFGPDAVEHSESES